MKKINDENKKKIQIVGLVALGLLLLVVGVTYAIFELTGNGLIESIMIAMKPEQEEVTISYTEKDYIDLNEVFPMPDIEGIAQEGTSSVMSFTVTGPAGVNYALALYDITEGETLKEEYVKVHLTKDGVPASVFTSDEGKFISSFWQNHILGEINGYVILLNSFTDISTTHNYTLKAWIDESYDLDQEDISGGTSHGVETISETFSFKVKVLFKDEELALLTEKTPPVCGEITGASTSWTAEDRTISVGCSHEHGCTQDVYTKTFNTTTEVATIPITSSSGYTVECPVNAYVDKTDYTITLDTVAGGTITSSKATAKVGETITITPTVASTSTSIYVYKGTTINNTNNGESVYNLDENQTTFIMPKHDVTLIPSYPIQQFNYIINKTKSSYISNPTGCYNHGTSGGGVADSFVGGWDGTNIYIDTNQGIMCRVQIYVPADIKTIKFWHNGRPWRLSSWANNCCDGESSTSPRSYNVSAYNDQYINIYISNNNGRTNIYQVIGYDT